MRYLLLNGTSTILGVTFVSPPHFLGKMGQGGEDTKITPKIVPFSASVLAVVTNNINFTYVFYYLGGPPVNPFEEREQSAITY